MAGSEDLRWNELRTRLDAVVLLLLESGPAPAATTTAKVERLLGLGFSPTEAAKMIGKPVNYVTSIKAQIKRKKATKEK